MFLANKKNFTNLRQTSDLYYDHESRFNTEQNEETFLSE